MLSILIPTKNYDCHLLVEELHRLGEKFGIPYEILVGEDGTSTENLTLNAVVDTMSNCRRIISAESEGRAIARNRLAGEAQYEFLIFIDSDAVVENEDFLELYAAALKNCDVVCGGLYHPDTIPNDTCTLRFKYEKNADKKRSAATRSKAPYNNFSTFNFAIKRDLFKTILFNEGITHYGHEDTLFGKELEKRGTAILHIDNMLLHSGLESNDKYLKKVEQSVMTLISIKELIGTTPLLDTAEKLRRLHLSGMFASFWKIFRNIMRKNLTSKHPSLKILAIYKLGYFCYHSR